MVAEDSTTAVIFIALIAGFSGLVSYNMICTEEHLCKDAETCLPLFGNGGGGGTTGMTMSSSSRAVCGFKTQSTVAILQSLNISAVSYVTAQGSCDVGMIMQKSTTTTDTSSSHNHHNHHHHKYACSRRLFYPNAINKAIVTVPLSPPSPSSPSSSSSPFLYSNSLTHAYCGKWIAASGDALTLADEYYFDPFNANRESQVATQIHGFYDADQFQALVAQSTMAVATMKTSVVSHFLSKCEIMRSSQTYLSSSLFDSKLYFEQLLHTVLSSATSSSSATASSSSSSSASSSSTSAALEFASKVQNKLAQAARSKTTTTPNSAAASAASSEPRFLILEIAGIFASSFCPSPLQMTMQVMPTAHNHYDPNRLAMEIEAPLDQLVSGYYAYTVDNLKANMQIMAYGTLDQARAAQIHEMIQKTTKACTNLHENNAFFAHNEHDYGEALNSFLKNVDVATADQSVVTDRAKCVLSYLVTIETELRFTKQSDIFLNYIQSYANALASTCVIETIGLVGASNDLSAAEFNKNGFKPFATLGSLKPSELHRLSSETAAQPANYDPLANLNFTAVKAASSVTLATIASSDCLSAANAIFKDETERVQNEFLLNEKGIKRLETLIDDVRTHLAHFVESSNLFKTPQIVSEAILNSKLYIPGSPLSSVLSNDYDPSFGNNNNDDNDDDNDGISGNDSPIVMIVKKARGVFKSNLQKVKLKKGICDLGSIVDSTTRNAYMYSGSTYVVPSCGFILLGMITHPFYNEQYDDVSIYSRIGYVVGHELAHVASSVEVWNYENVDDLLGKYYAKHTYREALADYLGAKSVLSVLSNKSLYSAEFCAHLTQIWCQRGRLLNQDLYEHPVNTRHTALCKSIIA